MQLVLFLEHQAMTQFINERHLEKHIRRTRTIYARRRQELIAWLNRQVGSIAKISPLSAGTHLLVRFGSLLPEDQLLELACWAELPMVSTRAYYASELAVGEMLIRFAHLDEAILAESIDRFAALLDATTSAKTSP